VVANPENCTRINSENPRADTIALGAIMSELMDATSNLENSTLTGTLTETTLRLKKPLDWSSDAVDFLTLTMTESANKLAEV